jgi:UDP-GlcNAc:undecaprenyl-phosphate GlcNAc-1-phosphate transferase
MNLTLLFILLLLFVFTTGFSLLINKLFLSYSLQFTPANDNSHRWSEAQKPTIGGFTFYIIFLFSLAIYPLLFPEDAFLNKQLISILLAVSFGFILGLADDVYGTNPFLKFLGQFFCANLLLAANIVIPITPFETVNYVFTVFWVIGLMNSINMLDNMDGIVASTTWCTMLGTFLLIILNSSPGNAVYLVMLIGVLGALTGFLFYNIYPSKMFMGDSGSQFLSVLLAALSILFYWPYRETTSQFIELQQFMLPLLFFIMPLIDTITVSIRRIARGESPFVGGKDHTTHHLYYLGLSHRTIMFLFFLISLISSGLGLLVHQYLPEWNLWYSFLIISYFIFVFTIMQLL